MASDIRDRLTEPIRVRLARELAALSLLQYGPNRLAEIGPAMYAGGRYIGPGQFNEAKVAFFNVDQPRVRGCVVIGTQGIFSALDYRRQSSGTVLADQAAFGCVTQYKELGSRLARELVNANARDTIVHLVSHSAGGPLCAAACAELRISGFDGEIRFTSYGSPKQGDVRLRTVANRLRTSYLRIWSRRDPVPFVPLQATDITREAVVQAAQGARLLGIPQTWTTLGDPFQIEVGGTLFYQNEPRMVLTSELEAYAAFVTLANGEGRDPHSLQGIIRRLNPRWVEGGIPMELYNGLRSAWNLTPGNDFPETDDGVIPDIRLNIPDLQQGDPNCATLTQSATGSGNQITVHAEFDRPSNPAGLLVLTIAYTVAGIPATPMGWTRVGAIGVKEKLVMFARKDAPRTPFVDVFLPSAGPFQWTLCEFAVSGLRAGGVVDEVDTKQVPSGHAGVSASAGGTPNWPTLRVYAMAKSERSGIALVRPDRDHGIPAGRGVNRTRVAWITSIRPFNPTATAWEYDPPLADYTVYITASFR